MVRRTRSQRAWDLVEHCFVGLAIFLFGLAIAVGPLVTDLVTLPQNRVVGVLIMAVGVLSVTSRALEHRRYLKNLEGRRSASSIE